MREAEKPRWLVAPASVLVVVLAAYSWNVHANGNAKHGEQLYAGACAGCHGEDGEGSAYWNAPRLAGLYRTNLLRQLRYFRDGIRGANRKDRYGWIMAGMVRSLPDPEAMEDVVAYIETLEAPPAPPTRVSRSGNSERGEAPYRVLCMGCHGSTGRGNYYYPSEDPPPNPALANQHDWYLLRQLKNFEAGLRGTHPGDKYGQWMRAGLFAQIEDEQELRDIVAYIQTLDGE